MSSVQSLFVDLQRGALIATNVQVAPQLDTPRPVAAVWHTILVLVVVGAGAIRGWLRADHLRDLANLDRIRLYESTICLLYTSPSPRDA